MADRIENNLPAESDAAYLRALDNSGNPIRISKADLSRVMAELIGTASDENSGLISPIQYKTILRTLARPSSGQSIDDLPQGFSYATIINSNETETFPSNGILISFQAEPNGGEFAQLFFGADGRVFKRVKWGPNISDLQQL